MEGGKQKVSHDMVKPFIPEGLMEKLNPIFEEN